MAKTRGGLPTSLSEPIIYSAVAEAFDLFGFIQAKAEAPPTGFDDLGIVAMDFGPF
jgi:hypothetical protein